jgi:hypothetical protein
MYELAAGLHVTVSTDEPPSTIEVGDALKVHAGFVFVTVTVALAAMPTPPAFTPATEYIVVVFGVTVQVEAVELAQLPPVQTYEVAAGVQAAVSVEEPPWLTDAGLAVSEHNGLAGCTVVKFAVRVTVAAGMLNRHGFAVAHPA